MSGHLPLAAANEFIDRARRHGVSHMKLQKLIYLSLEEWLSQHERSYLTRNPEVWPYGPVFSDLYHKLKSYRAEPIKDLQELFGETPRIEDPKILKVIDGVWEKYQMTSATDLSELTHRPGSPWRKVAERHDFSVPFGTEIPTDVIKSYVREKAKTMA